MPTGYLQAKEEEEAEVGAEKWAVEKTAEDSSAAQWTVQEKKKQKKQKNSHWWNKETEANGRGSGGRQKNVIWASSNISGVFIP